MSKVVLKEYKTWRDWLPARNIHVHPNQRKFTSNIFVSYLQASHPAVTGYGLFVDDNLIGYVFLIHAENPVQWIIDRLTIDKDYQRQGYAYDVVDQLIDMVYEFDNSEMVVARYAPDNEAARQLFAKLKFEEQEKMSRGRNIATLEFEFEEVEVDEEDIDDDDDIDVENLDDGDEEDYDDWDDEDEDNDDVDETDDEDYDDWDDDEESDSDSDKNDDD